MTRIRTILIDDEQLSLDVMKFELESMDFDFEILAMCTDPKDGIKKIHELKPELVFLDIEMPEIDGLQLLQSFDHIFFNVIFTTAYENYAVEAIRHQALDYLLKPIRTKELKRALERHQLKSIDIIQRNLSLLFEKLQKEKVRNKKVIIPTAAGLEFVAISDVLRCESASNYTYIYLRDGHKLFISKTLKEVGELLQSESFQRVHKSHLVNLDAIKRYVRTDGGSVVMEDGSVIPVSRNKKGDFLDNI